MRWLSAVIVVATWSVVDARPVHRPKDDLFLRRPACPPAKSWSTVTRCLKKQPGKLVVLHDTADAKLVAREETAPVRQARLELYLLARDGWTKASFSAETNAFTELLGFSRAGETFRIDMGHASAAWVTLDDASAMPAVIRRTFAYVCLGDGSCRSAVTACDVLVRGKAVATFRGELSWNGHALVLRGDTSATNRYCSVPASLLES